MSRSRVPAAQRRATRCALPLREPAAPAQPQWWGCRAEACACEAVEWERAGMASMDRTECTIFWYATGVAGLWAACCSPWSRQAAAEVLSYVILCVSFWCHGGAVSAPLTARGCACSWYTACCLSSGALLCRAESAAQAPQTRSTALLGSWQTCAGVCRCAVLPAVAGTAPELSGAGKGLTGLCWTGSQPGQLGVRVSLGGLCAEPLRLPA